MVNTELFHIGQALEAYGLENRDKFPPTYVSCMLPEHFYQLPDESYLVLIGSPVGDFSWQEIKNSLSLIADENLFSLPWEGRVILLRLSSDGIVWKLWNDWVGSIPVFHAKTNFGRIASTLEPVIVKIADTTSDRVYLPGLISLLLWGHYFHDWTLYPNIKVVPPDCFATWEDSKFIFNQYFKVVQKGPFLVRGRLKSLYTCHSALVAESYNLVE